MTQTALPQQGQQAPAQPIQQAQVAAQPNQTGQAGQPQKAIPLKRKGAGLNQLIAKTHKLGGQLLGLQITNGNLIAIFFSAMQITAGIVTFAWIMMGGWALLLTFVCAPLAILIERLSLGGLMVYRTASKGKMELEDSYHIKHIKKEATEREKYEYARKLKRLRSDRWTSGWLILLGIAISGYVGDQFWQKLFAPIGFVNSTILSILIAGSVSLTFVFSELYAEPSNKGIREAMMDNQISKAVLANSETDLQIELSMEAFGNLRSDPAKRLNVVNKIEDGMTTRLLDFAERAEYLLIGESEGSPKVQIQEVKQSLQLPTVAQSRVEFEHCKEELATLLETNKRMSRQKLADHFGVPKSTMQDWVTKLRKEAQQEETTQEETSQAETQAEEGQVEDGQDVIMDAEVVEIPETDFELSEADLEIPETDPTYADCKAELAAMLRDRPRMSRQKLADHFGVPKSTIVDWVEAVRKEAKAEDVGV